MTLLDRMNRLSEDRQGDMLIIRVADYSDLGKSQLFASIENYLALLRARLDAFKR